MKNISKYELYELIMDGITLDELDANYDYSHITNMSYLFRNCETLKSVPEFDTSNVTNIHAMFQNCVSLETVPHFDFSSVINAGLLFYNCTSLESVPNFNFSNVKIMHNMFYACNNLKRVHFDNYFDVTTSRSMFAKCNSLKSFDCKGFVSNDISYMFCDCESLERIPDKCVFNSDSNKQTEHAFNQCIISAQTLQTSTHIISKDSISRNLIMFI